MYDYTKYIVVSDTEYKAYLEKQARDELLVLQNRRNRYKAAIADLDDQIAAIEKAAGIETSNTSATLSSGSEDGASKQEWTMRMKSLSGSSFTKGKPKKTRQGSGKHSKPKAGKKAYRGQGR